MYFAEAYVRKRSVRSTLIEVPLKFRRSSTAAELSNEPKDPDLCTNTSGDYSQIIIFIFLIFSQY
jgi:hypothetical protein